MKGHLALPAVAGLALTAWLVSLPLRAAENRPAPNPNIDATSSYTSSKTNVWVSRNAVVPTGTNAIGYGDFDGDGITDVVAAYVSGGTQAVPIHILKGLGNGKYRDATSEIIAGPIPGTVHARKALVADLNGDGRPDIYIADHGYDQAPFPGAKNILLLSDGTGHLVWDQDQYQREPVGFHHSAAAGDIDNDGDVDLFVTDVANGARSPYFLINDGHGHFALDYSRVPASLRSQGYNALFTSELIDVDRDGYLDLIVGGHEFEGRRTTIYWGDGSGYYTDSRRTDLPSDAKAGIVLDIDAEDLNGDGLRDLVLTRTDSQPFYQGFYFQILMQGPNRTFADESLSRIIGDRSTWIGNHQNWIDWIRLVDINGDGVPDIRLDDAGRKLQWVNDGSGKFTPFR